jgi:hypothetical protein
MGTTTINVDLDESTMDALAKAAAEAGMSISAYLAVAARERMTRDAAARYGVVMTDFPRLAAEVAAARLSAVMDRAAAREQVLAKYR